MEYPAIASSARRAFLGHSAVAGGAAVSFTLPALATPFTAQSNASATPDQLMALGQRIAFDAIQALGTAQLQLLYVDHAGPSLDALRQGMEHALGNLPSYTMMSKELAGQYGDLVAQATFHEPVSGRQFRANVPASALEALAATAASLKTVMAADAGLLYHAA